MIGNCFWDIRYGSGLYNEYCANDTMVMGNYCLHTSVSSSWCTRLNIVENFFDGGTVVWHCRLLWPLRNSFMSMRGNALVDPPGGYLQHYGFGWGKSPYPEGFSNCWADYNRSRIRPEYPVLNDAGTKYKTLEEVRAKFGWEIHGECKPYDPDHNDLTPESMGGSTVTFRLPWGPRTYLARPMLSDSAVNGKFPAAAETAMTLSAPSFFWRVADGNCDDLDPAAVHALVRTREPLEAQLQRRLRPGREQRRPLVHRRREEVGRKARSQRHLAGNEQRKALAAH